MKEKKLTLDDGEIILFQVRKHWFVLAIEIGVIILTAILPLLFYIVMTSTIDTIMHTHAVFGQFLMFYCVWLILSWMTLFSIWTNYWLDVWTLTNKRFIAVDQHGLFSRTTASFHLERLQDVTISVNGIIATFLNFGSLEIQTAGEARKFKTSGLPDPESLKTQILGASRVVSAPVSQIETGGM
jgi:uncharacterized membrane protein YdbT with pleckstrin-like domain